MNTKGGYRPVGRLRQDLAEVQVGAVVYETLDAEEDRIISRGIATFRTLAASSPQLLAAADEFEARWRAADALADRAVNELRELAVDAGQYLDRIGQPA